MLLLGLATGPTGKTPVGDSVGRRAVEELSRWNPTIRRVIEMTRHKSILGALALCAISLCAFAASASASGSTAYTCKEAVGTPQYTDATCETESPTGKFSTVEIPFETTTEVTGEAVGSSTLAGTIALTKVTITCTSAPSTGDVKNIKPGEEMQAHGTKTVIDYSGCSAGPAAKPGVCEVEDLIGGKGNKGTILTNPLTSVTSSSGAEDFITFSPETAGEPFAKFKLLQKTTECPAALVGVTVTVTGSARGVIPAAKHSHITFSGTVGGALKANGSAAEYTGTNRGVMAGTSNRIGVKTTP
jgi:hypothetical protein